MNDSISSAQLEVIIEKFIPIIKKNLVERWNEWGINIDEQIKFEVIGGILSRQTSLVIQFLESISIWNGNIGTIILRSLAENYITISWLLKSDTKIKCQKFANYGIGQEVLYLEKLKASKEKCELTSNEKEQIDFITGFVEHERNLHVLDINVGAWSNISIREMAEEANCKEFYDLCFIPFTFSSHGTWNHILKYNVRESNNPLHNYIKIPIYHEFIPDIHWSEVAVKYLSMCYNKVDKSFNSKTKRISLVKIYSKYFEDLDIDELPANSNL